jgi:hypothetical protein
MLHWHFRLFLAKKKKEICSKRTEAINALINEAKNDDLRLDEEPRCPDDWGPVLNAFQEDLKVIGMEINSYKKYLIHLPRMQGRKQIRELERDLQSAINRLPQKLRSALELLTSAIKTTAP